MTWLECEVEEWVMMERRKEGNKTSYRMLGINLWFVHIISHYIYLYRSIAYSLYHIIFSYLILRSSTVLLNQASKIFPQILFNFERNVKFCPWKREKRTDTWETDQYFPGDFTSMKWSEDLVSVVCGRGRVALALILLVRTLQWRLGCVDVLLSRQQIERLLCVVV